MRGTKDEEKRMGPMFPRVHVNDTGKGGVRAPPRNQMSHYEQSSVPSQRHISISPSIWSLPPNTSSSFIPSFSSSHGSGRERNSSAPVLSKPLPSNLAEKIKSSSNSGIKHNTVVASQEARMTNAMNYPNFHPKVSLSSNAKSNCFQPYNSSNFKNFPLKNIGSSDHPKVPIVNQAGADMSREKIPQANTCLSLQLQTSIRKPLKGSVVVDEESREYVRNQCEEDATQSESCHNPLQGSGSILTVGDKASVGMCSSSSSNVKNSESLKRQHPLLHQETRSTSADVLNNVVFSDNLSLEYPSGVGRESGSKLRSEDFQRKPVEFNNGSLDRHKTISGCKQIMGIHGRDDVSDSFMMDSESAWNIFPDDVFKVIGKMQFRKIRTVIINQQRIFALQVFELHRLIKVQKLIAESPNLLLEDNLNTDRTAPAKKSSPALEIKPNVHSQKSDFGIEFSDERLIPNLPLLSLRKELITKQPNPVCTNTKSSPWCFPAHGNQWLVPVMSHSEGLVYKPYTGPCPPTSGLMAPIYSNDFFNTAFGYPASHQLSHTYFPPYGMLVQSSSVSCPPIEQMNAFSQAQSSCSMSSHVSQAMPCCLRNPQASKESDGQESTASSPPERSKCDVLPLFPTEPMCQNAETNEQGQEQQPLRAIRVIPHNPRAAPESAARILQSIQEEKKQYDSK